MFFKFKRYILLLFYLFPMLCDASQCNCNPSLVKSDQFYRSHLLESYLVFTGRVSDIVYFSDGDYLLFFDINKILKLGSSLSYTDGVDMREVDDLNFYIDKQTGLEPKDFVPKIQVVIQSSDYIDECSKSIKNHKEHLVFAKKSSSGALFIDVCGPTDVCEPALYNRVLRNIANIMKDKAKIK